MGTMAKQSTERTIIEVNGTPETGKPGKPRYRIVQRNGETVKLRVVDADSPRFAADFQAAFAANVRRARRENRAVDGD
ncbi:MAG TPA: hypothetical protein VFW19_06025 [Allosphingosinicella sp.]|nr:hypothetical protein [Allosphingosinicella sp.]